MGKTAYSTGDSEVQKLWDEELYRDTLKEIFWSKFFSQNGSSIVHEKYDLMKKKGDTITFTIRYRGNRAFLPDGTPIEGNEGSLQTSTYYAQIHEKNFGIRDAGMISRQRPVYDMDSETRKAILEDGAEALDNEFFNAIKVTNTGILYPASGTFSTTNTLATATAAVTASDLLSPALISKAKAKALTERANGQVPLRPVMIQGKPHLVLLVHPYALVDLKLDPTYAQANREAEVRGKENPLFTGAVGVWDGVIVHEHENVTKGVNAGSVYYSQNYLMGAQALTYAVAQKPTIKMEEFSYGQEHGFGYLSMLGVAKPQFTKPGTGTALDYGSYCVVTAVNNL